MSNATLVGLIKTTLIDFPARIACAVFLPGCNMRCPYCHNRDLVLDTGDTDAGTAARQENVVPIETVYKHLEKRRQFLTGIVISGGEALLSPELEPLIHYAKKLGYKIKLDTNGTLPEKLNAFIENSELTPDFIALDIKTAPLRYNELNPLLLPEQGHKLGANLTKTARYLQNLAIPVEYRTVLVPGLVTVADIPEMAALLPKDADWKFAPFSPGTCLDPLMNNAVPYSPAETEHLVSIARSYIPGATLR